MYKIFAGTVAIVILLYSCSTDSGIGSNTVDPTFSSISTNIFQKRCSCHQSESFGTPFLLTPDMAYQNLRQLSTEQPNLFRVDPGNPDKSYLYLKITGAEGITLERMPKGGPYLSSDQIEAIRQWIVDGAKNN